MTVELESWRKACIALVAISIIIGLVQRSGYQFLDTKFEVAIFHIPAIVSLMIYFSLSKRAAK
jgi:uncharacterized membrane protein